MKKEMDFLHSLNDIDDSFIEEATGASKKKVLSLYFSKLVPILSFSACLLLFMVFVFYKPSHEDQGVLVTNPYTEVSSLDKAKEELGYTLEIPSIENTTEEYYLINDMLEVQYICNNETKYTIRKAKGNEDISGIYTTYSETKNIQVDDIDITLKGSNNIYYLALWTSDSYSYSFYIVDGLDEDTLVTYIEQIR